ncbi:MAG: glutamate racemase [Bradyrhizobiaceae bacterium]|nr:glutamate racemase [Bradyrhizobiaceae bacterium]
MPVDTRPIGVFDSGIGGLTVLRQLVAMFPDERFVYLGDTARVPYGNKSADTVQRYSRECADFLLEHNVKLIVIACNTASALAIDNVRSFTDVPIIGMIEPAARHAVQASKTGNIGVIGTRATISSNAYEVAIRQVVTSSQSNAGRPWKVPTLVSRPCPLFVPLVEEGWTDTEATRMIAEVYLKPLLSQHIDTLVLGCTHYPLIAPLIQSIAPGVTLIDCGHAAAQAAADVLGQPTTRMTEPSASAIREHVSFYLTDYTPSFQMIAKDFLGVAVEEPARTILRDLQVPSQR